MHVWLFFNFQKAVFIWHKLSGMKFLKGENLSKVKQTFCGSHI